MKTSCSIMSELTAKSKSIFLGGISLPFFVPSERDLKVRRSGVGRGMSSAGLTASAAEKAPAASLLAFS